MRLVSWNVNGIRRIHKEYARKGIGTFGDFLDQLAGDVICIQELKVEKSTMDPAYVNVPGWRSYFTFPVDKKAYSGVAIYVREEYKPLRVETALCAPNYAANSPLFVEDEHMIGGYPKKISINEARLLDREGRVVLLDFGAFVLIGMYCPAGAETDDRIAYRRLWWRALHERCQNLIQSGRQIVLMGDLNVNCHAIDCVDAEADDYQYDNLGPVGQTFYRMLHGLPLTSKDIIGHSVEQTENYFVDLARVYHPDRNRMFSCWSVKLSARAGNHGSRIDYILSTKPLASYFTSSNVVPDVQGSDHCPVNAQIKPRHCEPHLAISSSQENENYAQSNFTASQATLSKSYFQNPPDQHSNRESTSTLERASKSPSPAKRQADILEKANLKSQKSIATFFKSSSKAKQEEDISLQEKGTQQSARSKSQNANSIPNQSSPLVRAQSIEKRIEVSNAFSSLFTKPIVPLCTDHQQPAKLQVRIRSNDL